MFSGTLFPFPFVFSPGGLAAHWTYSTGGAFILRNVPRKIIETFGSTYVLNSVHSGHSLAPEVVTGRRQDSETIHGRHGFLVSLLSLLVPRTLAARTRVPHFLGIRVHVCSSSTFTSSARDSARQTGPGKNTKQSPITARGGARERHLGCVFEPSQDRAPSFCKLVLHRFDGPHAGSICLEAPRVCCFKWVMSTTVKRPVEVKRYVWYLALACARFGIGMKQ